MFLRGPPAEVLFDEMTGTAAGGFSTVNASLYDRFTRVVPRKTRSWPAAEAFCDLWIDIFDSDFEPLIHGKDLESWLGLAYA